MINNNYAHRNNITIGCSALVASLSLLTAAYNAKGICQITKLDLYKSTALTTITGIASTSFQYIYNQYTNIDNTTIFTAQTTTAQPENTDKSAVVIKPDMKSCLQRKNPPREKITPHTGLSTSSKSTQPSNTNPIRIGKSKDKDNQSPSNQGSAHSVKRIEKSQQGTAQTTPAQTENMDKSAVVIKSDMKSNLQRENPPREKITPHTGLSTSSKNTQGNNKENQAFAHGVQTNVKRRGAAILEQLQGFKPGQTRKPLQELS